MDWFSSQLEEAQKKAVELKEEAKQAALAHAEDLREEAAALREEAARGAAALKEEAARGAAEMREAASAASEEAARAAAEIKQAAQHHTKEIQRDDGTQVLSFAEGPLGFHLQGATVLSVEPEGQAAILGLNPGDVVVAVAGEDLPCAPTDCEPNEADRRHRALIQRRIKTAPRPVQLRFRKITEIPATGSPSGESTEHGASEAQIIASGGEPSDLAQHPIAEISRPEVATENDTAVQPVAEDVQEQNLIENADEHESKSGEEFGDWDFGDETQPSAEIDSQLEVEKERNTENTQATEVADPGKDNDSPQEAAAEIKESKSKAVVEESAQEPAPEMKESQISKAHPDQDQELTGGDQSSKVKVWSTKEWKAKLDSVWAELHEAQKHVAQEQETNEDMQYELQAAERELQGVKSEKAALHDILKKEEIICAEVQNLRKKVQVQSKELGAARQSEAAISQELSSEAQSLVKQKQAQEVRETAHVALKRMHEDSQLELQQMLLQRSALQAELQQETQSASFALTSLKTESSEATEDLLSELQQRQSELGIRLEEENTARSAAIAHKDGLEEQLTVARREMRRLQDNASSLQKEKAQMRQELHDQNASFTYRDQRVGSAHALLENHAQSLREQLTHSQSEYAANLRDAEEALHNAKVEADDRIVQIQSSYSSELRAAKEEQHSMQASEQRIASDLKRIKEELLAAQAHSAEVSQTANTSLVDFQATARMHEMSLQSQVESETAAKESAEQRMDAAQKALEEQKAACATAQESESSHRQLIHALQQELLEVQESLRSEGQELLQAQEKLLTTEEAAILKDSIEPSTDSAAEDQQQEQHKMPTSSSQGLSSDDKEEPVPTSEPPLAAAKLREELDLLTERNRVLQRRLDAQPIMFKPSPEELEQASSASSAAALQNMPPWQKAAYVALDMFLNVVVPPLKLLTEQLLKRRIALVAFWFHIFVLYTIFANHFLTQSPDVADPSKVAEEFMQQKSAAPSGSGSS
eukprot:gnl/MRDRNA2_/MRDRNA2_112224_c0_seq1.p1 gnl/MRDRNA2_/MRDRNA2_112224_c0~~gnl/MRDRNA2_/MRDRNA2_112224_c0_seq1.p1  ORF type:complete len:996 (+),score=324.10 gnl/MRDRNA2_/MRDRNA2_112224_c0_seq1:82-3069(+)